MGSGPGLRGSSRLRAVPTPRVCRLALPRARGAVTLPCATPVPHRHHRPGLRQPLRRRPGRRRGRAGRGRPRRARPPRRPRRRAGSAPRRTATPAAPFAAPVETVVEPPTPAPTQSADARPPTPHAAKPDRRPPTQPPAQAAARETATPAHAPTAPAAPGRSASTRPSARKARRKPNRADGQLAGDASARPRRARSARSATRPQPRPQVETASRRIEARSSPADRSLGDDTPAPTRARRRRPRPRRTRPTRSPPPGPAPIGVPNFFIEKFRIPPFLLPIYQAAGIQYGVRWEVLAAINEIETDYGRNLNISSAGALGWMQFMPATWDMYGVDANGDGEKDPFNPVDAIFAAARYLRAAGADKDLYRAIFAYNHADWYVESVLMRARVIGGLPADLVGSLTGLTQGRFPVAARRRPTPARCSDARAPAARRSRARTPPTSSSPTATRRAIRHLQPQGRAGGRRQRRPHHPHRPLAQARPLRRAPGRLRQHLPLLRAGEVAETYPFPKERKARKRELALPEARRRARAAPRRSRRRRTSTPPASAACARARSRPKPAKQRARRGADATAPRCPPRSACSPIPSAPNAQAAGGDEQLAAGRDRGR